MSKRKRRARKDRERRESGRGRSDPRASVRARARWIAAAGVLLLAGLLAWSLPALLQRLGPVPEVPSPDLTSMETQVAEAISAARERVTASPRAAGPWAELGMVLHAHELFFEAIACYREAQRLDPEDFRWPYLKAQAHTQVQELEEAEASLRIALGLEEDYAPLYILKAQLEERAGRDDAAMSSYRRALLIDERSAVAAFGVGRLALAANHLEESRAQLERARELQPEAGAIRATLARVYRRQNEPEAARREARAARELEPPVTLNDRVMAAVSESAVSLVGLQERANAAEARGDRKEAERLLRRMVELRPDEANLYYNLANVLARQERVEEAAATFREALERDGAHTGSLMNLGLLEAQAGRFEEAGALFERVLEVEPEHAAALANLGRLAASEGDIDRAVALLERAVEREPRAETFYALSQVLLRAGRLQAAVETLEDAVTVAPGNGTLHFELALAQAERGSYAAAWAHVDLAERAGFAVPADFLSALGSAMPDPR